MNARLSPTNIFVTLPEAGSATTLIERGLQYIRQGSDSEGFALLLLAREQLTSPTQITMALDDFAQGYVRCCQAQQALFLASKHFSEVDIEQNAKILALEKMLSLSIEEKNNASSTLDRWEETASSDQVARGSRSADNLLAKPLMTTRVEEPPAINALPSLSITCFGCFEVRRLDKSIVLCSNRNGQAILRYLVAQSGCRASADKLMSLFWREDESEIAQRKLQVAISLLRTSLNEEYDCRPGGGYIICKNGIYQLNPKVTIYTDVNEFLTCYRRGLQDKQNVIALFEQACRLYTGPFLVEDIYSDWSLIQREQLAQIYLTMCNVLTDHFLHIRCYADAITWATAILKENRCDEAAYRQLMKAYAAQGRRSEALRQYQRCQQALAEELEFSPMPETTQLFQSILQQESPPLDQACVDQT